MQLNPTKQKMKNPFKKISNWNRERIEMNYQDIISQYSPKGQELIKKGRNVILTHKSLKQLMEENPSKEITPLTETGTLYKFWPTGTPVGKTLKHSFVPYNSRTLGMRDYSGDVENWLEIGKLGADMLCNYISRPADLSDAGGVTVITLGIPIKIESANSSQNATQKPLNSR